MKHKSNYLIKGCLLSILLLFLTQSLHAYYNPAQGKWLSRDPIAERGGLNINGFVGNDAVNRSDYLGLKNKRTCEFTVIAGHGWFPTGENNTPHPDASRGTDHENSPTGGPAGRRVDSYINSRKCGDRVGQVSCFAGDVNDHKAQQHPEAVIPNMPGNRHDPDTPLWDPDSEDPLNPDWNENQPGYLSQGDALAQLESAIIAAENTAESDCDDAKTCCSKIKISVKAMFGGRPNFAEFAAKSARGRKLINYDNSYNCKKGEWKNEKISNR